MLTPTESWRKNGESSLPWESGQQNVTLLAMAKFLADIFIGSFRNLHELEVMAERRLAAESGMDVGDSFADLIQRVVKAMDSDCGRLRLTTPLKRSRRIFFDLEFRPNSAFKWSDAHYELKAYREAVEDAVEDCIFISIPQDKICYVAEPTVTVFEGIGDHFPTAAKHLETAGKCLASSFSDACVYHCMNALEFGIRALAAEVGTIFKAEIEVENWKNVIDAIESDIQKKIKRIEQNEPKSLEKLAKLKAQADTAMQFRYFKDAWRNHVAHGRDSYDEHQAETILTHVTDFMRLLIQRGLSE